MENCVCILHNLSYHLEKEAPDHFKQLPVPDENSNKKSLFSPKSTKTPKVRAVPDKMTCMQDVLDAGHEMLT